MHTQNLRLMAFVVLPALICGSLQTLDAYGSEGASRISPDHVRQLLGNPDTVIIDVRKPRNWWRTGKKIQGAVREDPSMVDQWLAKYRKDQTLIFY